jgi:cell division cycle 20-like protein 1, cofactor of APC complex
MALAEGPGGGGGVTGAATAAAGAPASPPPPPQQPFATPATPGGGAMTGATMPATPPRSASGVGASTTGTVGGGGGGGEGGGDGGGAGGAYAALLRAELLGAPPPPLPPPATIPGSPARLPPPSPAGRRVLAYADDSVAGRRASGTPASAAAAAALFSAGAAHAASPARPPRKVARTPFKVLDAPALADDFYLNLVDWSSSNVLAVGLGTTVYLWSAATAKVTKLVDLAGLTAGLDGASAAGPLPADPAGGDAVCSVAWSGRGTYLAVGTGSGTVQLWDVAAGARVRCLGGHRGRVGAMAWSGPTLATGSRDRTILQRDVRAPPGPSADDADAVTARLGAHRSEVCGLRWSPGGGGGRPALASGGNDNLLHVWCPRRPDTPRLRLAHHTAAIKALAWSPHQHGLLASGGGTADRCIRVWNTAAGPGGGGGGGNGGGGSSMASAGAAAVAAAVASAAAAATAAGWPAPPPPPPGDPGPPPLGVLDTGSQVCNLAWARHANELVSTHGYSQNQVALWRYGGPGGPGALTRLATLTGHTLRVLYLAAAPDGQTVVTGAGDETLRFWSVFPGPRPRGGGGDGDGPVPLGAMARANIR